MDKIAYCEVNCESDDLALEINGRIYDTAQSKMIGRWVNGCMYNSLCYCGEYLFKTNEGEFFLVGNGGGLNDKFFKIAGQRPRSGCRFVLLTEEEATAWMNKIYKNYPCIIPMGLK